MKQDSLDNIHNEPDLAPRSLTTEEAERLKEIECQIPVQREIYISGIRRYVELLREKDSIQKREWEPPNRAQ
jgi:hypothetical protein